ncbi:PE family protein, partial [Mycobacterium marinum]|uniref:PE family protein n=1 Tax=Mycobacterium marinum TaxID=1781 RepID=UPI0021C2C8B6
MSFVITTPDMVADAAAQLAQVRSELSAASAAAAGSTTGIAAAAEDEVSAAIAALFSAHGQAYQLLGSQATAFHDEFVRAMTAGANAYAGAEAANTGPLQLLLGAINAPVQALTGRPLIGNGANGAPGTGDNGSAGGWLLGSGGAGDAPPPDNTSSGSG